MEKSPPLKRCQTGATSSGVADMASRATSVIARSQCVCGGRASRSLRRLLLRGGGLFEGGADFVDELDFPGAGFGEDVFSAGEECVALG